MGWYTVQTNDSWTKIAGQKYGNQRWFQELQKANPHIGGVLKAGMKIFLPNFNTSSGQQPLVETTTSRTKEANWRQGQTVWDWQVWRRYGFESQTPTTEEGLARSGFAQAIYGGAYGPKNINDVDWAQRVQGLLDQQIGEYTAYQEKVWGTQPYGVGGGVAGAAGAEALGETPQAVDQGAATELGLRGTAQLAEQQEQAAARASGQYYMSPARLAFGLQGSGAEAKIQQNRFANQSISATPAGMRTDSEIIGMLGTEPLWGKHPWKKSKDLFSFLGSTAGLYAQDLGLDLSSRAATVPTTAPEDTAKTSAMMQGFEQFMGLVSEYGPATTVAVLMETQGGVNPRLFEALQKIDPAIGTNVFAQYKQDGRGYYVPVPQSSYAQNMVHPYRGWYYEPPQNLYNQVSRSGAGRGAGSYDSYYNALYNWRIGITA